MQTRAVDDRLRDARSKTWRLDKEEAGAKLRHSFAGRMGRFIEPAIAPLGFDWKIGIGIVASFAAREVFVSTMSTVYNVGKGDEDEEPSPKPRQNACASKSGPTARRSTRR